MGGGGPREEVQPPPGLSLVLRDVAELPRAVPQQPRVQHHRYRRQRAARPPTANSKLFCKNLDDLHLEFARRFRTGSVPKWPKR